MVTVKTVKLEKDKFGSINSWNRTVWIVANCTKQSADSRLELPLQPHPIVFWGQILCQEVGLLHQGMALAHSWSGCLCSAPFKVTPQRSSSLKHPKASRSPGTAHSLAWVMVIHLDRLFTQFMHIHLCACTVASILSTLSLPASSLRNDQSSQIL